MSSPSSSARKRVSAEAARVLPPSPAREGEDEVVSSVLPNGLAVLRLNRPRALNALSMRMVELASASLRAWASDDAVRAVLIEGTGERALCAGGDIRKLVDPPEEGYGERFFRLEYQMDHLVGTYPKPVVSLLRGIVMGGGVGLTVHGDFRVATDSTLFAMPETGIGLFPDVGGSHFLGRRGALGMYLGLTGARLRAADAVYAGVATHFVPLASLPALRAALAAEPLAGGRAAVAALLERFAGEPPGPPPPLAARQADMERTLGEGAAASLDGALAALRREADGGSEWAAATLRTLATKSPTSLRITFRALREGRRLTLAEALRREYRLAVRIVRARGDLREGVRAVIVDKDNRPAWSPSTLAGVRDAYLDSYFAPFAARERVAELDLP